MLLFALLCTLNLCLYCGPNIASFVLPILAFPADVRSTFHGISAAAAKLGAMAGTLLFPELDRRCGIPSVMLAQALLGMLAALLSHCYLEATSARARRSEGKGLRPGRVGAVPWEPRALPVPWVMMRVPRTEKVSRRQGKC
ncbi:unnamed protein product [Polarella glacialis]|nr:unnamed protein product [Polarella glacialis]